MPSEFIGSLVSIDCGQLGAYQGRVVNIDPVMNTLTISHAFRNGLCCDQPEISLSSTAILDIRIIHASQEAQEIIARKATPSKMTKEIDEVTRPTCALPVKIIKATSKVQPASSGCGVNHLDLAYNKSGCSRRVSPTSVPSKFHELSSEPLGRRARVSKSANRESSEYVATDIGNIADHRGRKTNAVKKSDKNIECFHAPAKPFKQEFDFESNLALFDKKVVFREIEHRLHDVQLESDPRDRRYRHDENVLQPREDNSTRMKKIQQPDSPYTNCQLYFTDTGLAVPSISVEVREKVCDTASQCGLTHPRLLEAYGRGASEMAIHLIGGSHRIHPKNGHQVPAVVVLCGLHDTGALGACCARNSANIPVTLSQEIELYKLTGNRLIHNVTDLPSTIDLIVTALDSPASPAYSQLPWYQSIVAHIKTSDIRAQMLALDPPSEGPGIAARWSLCKVLPLHHMASTCGSLYLCDLSIPSAIFNKCGITYLSPFGSKFVIPLYGKD
ncbi:unnamed protein product [Candidula unifasciata]|uniref:Enhancer of mRNA-decapping protein 3 n=1 Tax=Candidula unifasciata TaxID=100452 RepID=A0A8S4A3A1_9EUPU|nr:unnamed protein product [Candidula unifasciata]